MAQYIFLAIMALPVTLLAHPSVLTLLLNGRMAHRVRLGTLSTQELALVMVTSRSPVAQTLIDDIFNELKQFNDENGFIFTDFEANMPRLKTMFSQLEQAVSSASNIEPLNTQLSFVRQVFEKMEALLPYLHHYKDSHSTYHCWIYELVELNVQVLSLHNTYGYLDRLTENYADRLQRMRIKLATLIHGFRSLFEPPAIAWMLVGDLATEAENTLNKLRSQIP